MSRPVNISPLIKHEVADFQRAHLRFCQWRGQIHFASGERKSGAARHALDGPRRIAVQPFGDGAARCVESHAQAAESPAFIRDGNEKARGQTVRRGDLATDQRSLAAEAHRADAQLVRLFHDFGFELCERGIGIHIVQRAEKLRLRQVVAMRAIAADAYAHRSGRTTLSLRLPHGMQDAFAHAFEVAIGPAHVVQSAGHGILNVLVLAPAAFEDQFDFDVIVFPLVEMDHRRFFAQIVAAVFSGERIHRVRAQLAEPRSFRDRLQNRLPDLDLVHADRGVDHERRHARILADRSHIVVGHVHIGQNNIECLGRLCARGFIIRRNRHRGANIRREIRGRLSNQFEQAAGKEFHFTTPKPVILHFLQPLQAKDHMDRARRVSLRSQRQHIGPISDKY